MTRSALMVCGCLLVAAAYWAALQPVNEQLRDGEDPWPRCVREQVAAK